MIEGTAQFGNLARKLGQGVAIETGNPHRFGDRYRRRRRLAQHRAHFAQEVARPAGSDEFVIVLDVPDTRGDVDQRRARIPLSHQRFADRYVAPFEQIEQATLLVRLADGLLGPRRIRGPATAGTAPCWMALRRR